MKNKNIKCYVYAETKDNLCGSLGPKHHFENVYQQYESTVII
jgi:hypothetical protein